MIYSRRLRVEERKDRVGAIWYVLISIILLVLLFTFGIPYTAKLIGFVSDFRNSDLAPVGSDTTPPAPPYINSLPEETNSNNIEVTGSAEEGATIVASSSGKSWETLTNTEGSFLMNLDLMDGENLFTFKAKDKSGNESVSSTLVKVIMDNDPPELGINHPIDGSSFYGSKNKVVEVSGKTELGSAIYVAGHKAVVGFDGTFKSYVTLNTGTNDVVITSKDQAGNESEAKITLNYTE